MAAIQGNHSIAPIGKVLGPLFFGRIQLGLVERRGIALKTDDTIQCSAGLAFGIEKGRISTVDHIADGRLRPKSVDPLDGISERAAVEESTLAIDDKTDDIGQFGLCHGKGHPGGFIQRRQRGRHQKIGTGLGQTLDLPGVKRSGGLNGQSFAGPVAVVFTANQATDENRIRPIVLKGAQSLHEGVLDWPAKLACTGQGAHLRVGRYR